MQDRQTKARRYFPLRDPERSEYNSGVRSHRTAWADSRRRRLEVRGHEYHRSDRQLSVRWESLCPIETNCPADQDHSSWAYRNRQPGSRCGSVRVSARTPLRTKKPGRPTLSNASKLQLRFQPLRRHRLWQLLVRYLALGKTGNREQRLENGCRPRNNFFVQPRRNRYVLRLYECIGAQRLASGARNLVVHGASCVTGIGLHIALTPVSSQEPLQPGQRWRGKGGRRE
jgi:hypothetical protein